MGDTSVRGYQRAFSRFELKYLIHYREYRLFRKIIRDYVRPDPYCDREGFYKISSLYYDSPGYACFWEKIEGLKFRRKFRIRTYDNDDDRMAFMEIKQRIDRTLQKRRTRLPLDLALAIAEDPDSGPYRAGEDRVMDEILYLVETQLLEPQMVISYQREAFMGVFEDGLRITFDHRCKYRNQRLDIGGVFDEGNYFIPPELLILEVKFNEMVPLWLCSYLNKLECRTQRISKYCTAVKEAVYGGKI